MMKGFRGKALYQGMSHYPPPPSTNVLKTSDHLLTTMDVPRAVSGQLGSGSRECAAFQIVHVYVEYLRICVDLNSYDPFHWCAHYFVGFNLWRTKFVFPCWWIITQGPASNWECALPLYCRNSFSDGVWPFVVARAPRHMPRGVLGVPMKRMSPGRQVADLGIILYALNSLVDCTLHQKLVYIVCLLAF